MLDRKTEIIRIAENRCAGVLTDQQEDETDRQTNAQISRQTDGETNINNNKKKDKPTRMTQMRL